MSVCEVKYATTTRTRVVCTLFSLPLAPSTAEVAVNITAKISWAEVSALEANKPSRHPSPIFWTLPRDGLGGYQGRTQYSALRSLSWSRWQ